jgi:hypothetical protein
MGCQKMVETTVWAVTDENSFKERLESQLIEF